MFNVMHKSAFLFISVAGFALQAHAATTINSLPYTLSTSGETYILGANLTHSGTGAALTISAADVVLDGQGRTLTYCNSGSSTSCLGIDVRNSRAKITNLTLTKGSNTGTTTAINGTNATITGFTASNLNFNLAARTSAPGTYGVRVYSSGGTNEITGSTFSITGADAIQAIDNSSGGASWNVSGNTFDVRGLQYSVTYARVIMMGSNSTYQNNTFNVDSASHYVNLLVSWEQRNSKILSNTINFASHHGRPIQLDNGSDGFEVANNTFRITSPNAGDEVTYAIRIRGDTTTGSNNHIIHNNVIDATGSTTVAGISIGNIGRVCTGNRIYSNVITGADTPIEFYADTAQNTALYCNKITDSGRNYPIYVNGSAHSGISFAHNSVTSRRGDGKKMFFVSNQTYASTWSLCDSGLTASLIGGNLVTSTLSLVTGLVCPTAGTGTTGCDQDAGLSASVVRPEPPASVIVN